MNTMQRYFATPNGRETALKIIKLFHPNRKLKHVQIDFKYDWVILSNIGVSIGIEFNHALCGSDIKINDFIKAHKNESFRAWRFYDDGNPYDKTDHSEEINAMGIPKPTPEEMYKYYYKE